MPISIQRDGYNLKGSETNVKPNWGLPVIGQTGDQLVTTTFTAGTDFTIPAGAAATVVKIPMKNKSILGTKGRVGRFGNTSFAFGGAAATTFTTEVAFIGDVQQEGGDATTLTNGQYMVDYETGIIYGKKADAGVTGTATYSYYFGAASSGGGTYNTTPPTLVNGSAAGFQLDVNGNLKIVEQNAAAAENNTLQIIQVATKGTMTRMSTATTTTVKSGAGILNGITINKGIAASTITVYDNTAASGTIIALITFGAALLTDPPITGIYNVAFSTGCTIVTSGAVDITISTT